MRRIPALTDFERTAIRAVKEGGTANDTLVPLCGDEGFFMEKCPSGIRKNRKIFIEEETPMAKEKKFVESITDMELDFPQWYTDVVKKLT